MHACVVNKKTHTTYQTRSISVPTGLSRSRHFVNKEKIYSADVAKEVTPKSWLELQPGLQRLQCTAACVCWVAPNTPLLFIAALCKHVTFYPHASKYKSCTIIKKLKYIKYTIYNYLPHKYI